MKIIILIIPLFFPLLIIPFIINPVYKIFPSNNLFSIYSFCDETENGNSEINNFKVNDSKIVFSYILKEGDDYPFAGFALNYLNPYGVNISEYNQIKIKIKSSKSKRIRLCLRFFEPNIKNNSNPFSIRYFIKEIEISNISKNYILKFEDFETPVWWYKITKFEQDQGKLTKKYLKQLYNIEIQNGELMPLNLEDEITLESVTFEKNIFTLIFVCGLSIILYYIVFIIFILINNISKKRLKLINHKKLDITNFKDIEHKKVFDYLYENYNKPDISISSINAETGVSKKKIPIIIKENTNLSFKQYLNNLRLTEAKRLILETDRNMTEIAFYIGYNSSSHFTRIFTQFYNISPKDYKKLKLKK